MDVERDIKRYFQDQLHLQGTQGPVLVLLQAYLNRVLGIQYQLLPVLLTHGLQGGLDQQRRSLYQLSP